MSNRDSNDEKTNRSDRRLGRRDVLKTTAAAAVAAGGLTGSASASHLNISGSHNQIHHDDYTEVQVYENGVNLWVDDYETVENVWVHTNGYYFNVQARAEGWTIRNFALDGLIPDGHGTAFSLAARNGTECLMEDVYLGDGGAGDWRDKHQNGSVNDQPTATFTFDDHTGTITYRNIYANNWTDNAFYNGNMGTPQGTLVWENIFVENSDISAFRIRDNDGYMYNCHATGNTHRDAWIRGSGTMQIDGSELAQPNNAITVQQSVSTAQVENTSYASTSGSGSVIDNGGNNNNPNPEPPASVPMTPEDAVLGDGDGGESGDPPEYPVIEDFERDNPLADYGGSTDQFGTTGSAYEGDAALENASGDFGGVNSTSDLNNYPSRGDDFEVYFDNATGDNFVAVNFFTQAEEDDPDRYSVGLSGASGDFTFWRTSGGDIDTLDSASPSNATSGWYRVEISTDSSSITADLYDDSSGDHLASVSTGDSTFDSGGIGFRSAGNGEVFDYAVFTEDGPTVVEDFERSSPLSEYGGETGLFDTTGSAYEGEQALENDSGSFGGVNSTSGLDTYPERGDEVHAYFDNAGDENFATFNLFSQAEEDDPDRYSVGISGVSGDLTLWKTENGSIDTLDSSSLSDTTSGWYRVEITTDSSTVSADLYDADSDAHLASVSASDSTFTSGGIGFRSAGNGEVFDYVVIDE